MASFHLLWKENYVKHQKFSKFYNHDSLQNFLSLFMSLLTAPIVKNSHILAGVYFIFLKNILDQSSKSFNIKSWPQGLRVTKTVKKPLKNQVWRSLVGVVSRVSYIPNIWDKLKFLCEIVHYGKNSISIFEEFFASIDKIFILAGRLDTRL